MGDPKGNRRRDAKREGRQKGQSLNLDILLFPEGQQQPNLRSTPASLHQLTSFGPSGSRQQSCHACCFASSARSRKGVAGGVASGGWILAGNLTGDGIWTYSYDAANRLHRMHKTDMSLEFNYDHAGRRVDGARQRGDGHAEWRASGLAGARGAGRHRRRGGGASRQKKVWSNATFSGDPTTWLRYAYQGMELVAELSVNPSTGAITLSKSFHWGLDKSDTRGGAGGAMGLLMWRDYAASKSYYPSFDLSGNLTSLLDGSTGQYVAWYEYDAFGKRESVGGTMAEANPIGFSTQYTDRETGLVYYGFRFYDPSKGRLGSCGHVASSRSSVLNRDPIGEAGGRNLYRFVGNDPIGRVDKWGLAWRWSTCATTETVKFEYEDEGHWVSAEDEVCFPGWVWEEPYTRPTDDEDGGGGSDGGGDDSSSTDDEKKDPCDYFKGREYSGKQRPDKYTYTPFMGPINVKGGWEPPSDSGVDWAKNTSGNGYMFEAQLGADIAFGGITAGHAWVLGDNGVLSEYKYSGVAASGGLDLPVGGSLAVQFGVVRDFGQPSDYSGFVFAPAFIIGNAIFAGSLSISDPFDGTKSGSVGVHVGDMLFGVSAVVEGYELIRFVETDLHFSSASEWRDFAFECFGLSSLFSN